jgi:hypothetical protein
MRLSESKETHSVFTSCLCEIGVWFLCKVANCFRCRFLTNSNDEVMVFEDLEEAGLVLGLNRQGFLLSVNFPQNTHPPPSTTKSAPVI